MNIFEQLKAAKSEMNKILTTEAEEVDALWESARIASKKHSKRFSEVELQILKLRKECERANTVMRCD